MVGEQLQQLREHLDTHSVERFVGQEPLIRSAGWTVGLEAELAPAAGLGPEVELALVVESAPAAARGPVADSVPEVAFVVLVVGPELEDRQVVRRAAAHIQHSGPKLQQDTVWALAGRRTRMAVARKRAAGQGTPRWGQQGDRVVRSALVQRYTQVVAVGRQRTRRAVRMGLGTSLHDNHRERVSPVGMKAVAWVGKVGVCRTLYN